MYTGIQSAVLIRRLNYVIFVSVLLAAGLAPALCSAFAGIDGAGTLVVVHLLVTAFLAASLGWFNPRAALVFLMLLLPWQPFFSMPFSDALGSTGIKLIVATKEVYATIFLSVLFLKNSRKVRWGYADIAALAFIAAYAIYFMKSPAGVAPRIASFKEGLMVVSFYLIGRLTLFSRDDITWMLRTTVAVAFFVAAFGFVERFLFDGLSWKYIGAVDYLESKMDTSQFGSIVINDLPLNWFTYLGNTPVRRMVGPIGDATSLSRFLALPVLALIYMRSIAGRSRVAVPVRLVLLFFLGSALALTLGRGGQVILIGGLLVLIFARRPVVALLIAAPLVLALLAELAIFDPQSGSAIRHMAGLEKGVGALFDSPLGNGLGTSGQMAVLYGKVDVKVSESYIGSLAFQMGLPGVLLYTLFFTLISAYFLRAYRLCRRTTESWAMPLLAFTISSGIFFTSILANSAIAPISSGLSLIFCGAVKGALDHERAKETLKGKVI
ncbi:MAG TPA: hypothetical protein DDW94_03375 [Deltaproteobacteria bacterium]|nr:MAG: hypothetical protein A2Z79_10070 [Deltaproteobacteria bacterium GWA2_55_82]OGQ63018.1 MAG: hypothetical protein A3I81_06900 [Deltaproteobacteria bacterium RIFCSPLOWO2_02_FULL_55_12]OIJ72982.1 MAG: hypothetical protein A2V21_301135 [Deltaproteobacteria bacterium GWC2_55_46]HBG46009.1 hypothetical protein [Deltaproteobacteria bacterium]HCY11773.1 hypothetical protein [Deltaproteobacteria bacterium]